MYIGFVNLLFKWRILNKKGMLLGKLLRILLENNEDCKVHKHEILAAFHILIQYFWPALQASI